MSTTSAFYAYRLPGEETAQVGTGCAVTTVEHMSELKGRTAFVIREFDGHTHILQPTRSIVTTPAALPAFGVPEELADLPTATPEAEYMEGAEAIIADLRLHPDRKVVYSRIVVADRTFTSIEKRFAELCTLYPQAYVFCYYTPQTGLWMGASPELLVRRRHNIVHTMALAGTKRIDDTRPWDYKNVAEHAFVSRFITRQFTDFEIGVAKSQPVTLEAGPVKHLCTRFTSKKPVHIAKALLFVESLFPTPAVCGTPRPYAMRMIRSHEQHSRSCYGGFAGPINARGDFAFWVNLRSMRVGDSQVALYVGGGLTRQSSAADERDETSAKALTLIPL